jgi:hypothetical protein
MVCQEGIRVTYGFSSQSKRRGRQQAAKYQGVLRFARERAMVSVREAMLSRVTMELRPVERLVEHRAVIKDLNKPSF